MDAEGRGTGDDFSAGEDDFESRPFGARPFGARPFGARPFGARPFGARPFGARPFGARPFGARPFGARPFGARPFGARPFGARAAAAERDGFDPEEWSADVAALFCERAALVRSGATLFGAEHDVPIASFDPSAGYRAPGAAVPAPGGVALESLLYPRDLTLVGGVTVREGLLRALRDNPELAVALKLDLAEVLAHGVDAQFLEALAGAPAYPPGADLLQTLRGMVAAVRTVHAPPAHRNPLRAPGWILHPDVVAAVEGATSADGQTLGGGRSLDSLGLLELDGLDGGMLLGFPFVTSAAAWESSERRIYFSADWAEAWIAVAGNFVAVELSTEGPGPGSVIRATMSHAFGVRRQAAFAWSHN